MGRLRGERPRPAGRGRLQPRPGAGGRGGCGRRSGRARHGSSRPSWWSAAPARSPPAAPPGWACGRPWRASSATTFLAASCSTSWRRAASTQARPPSMQARPTGLSVVLTEPGDRATLTSQGTIGALDRRDGGRRSAGPGPPRAHRRLVPAGSGAGAGRHPAPGAGGRCHHLARPRCRPRRRWDGGLLELLPEIDQLLPNEVEALALAGTGDVEQAAKRLAALRPGGARSSAAPRACWRPSDGELVRAPALAVQVVDTIGAGDSTNAGWLAGRLRGWPARAGRPPGGRVRIALDAGPRRHRRPADVRRGRSSAVILCAGGQPLDRPPVRGRRAASRAPPTGRRSSSRSPVARA